MSTGTNKAEINPYRCNKTHYRSRSGDAVYGLGFIGASIFFIGQATTFWMGALALLKALVWPVFLVLETFKALR